MKKLVQLTIVFAITFAFMACSSPSKKETTTKVQTEEATTPEKPSDAELMAFKVYHHMVYMKYIQILWLHILR